MKKEIVFHLGSVIVFFLIITLLHNGFAISFLPFWIGGLVGVFLPDIDHLIYIYFLRPHELTSQRATSLISQGAISQGTNLLVATKYERSNAIFHTIWFQLLFLALTVWVITSSNSLLGRGLVLAFSSHLVIDQLVDLQQVQNLNAWFSQVKVTLTRDEQLYYLIAIAAVILILGIL